MKLLHIDSSILGEGSASRALTAAVVKRFSASADTEITHRDLAMAALPHATVATLPGDHPLSAMAGELDGPAQAIRAESQALLDEFLAADIIVVGVPMYNFGIPSQLKAWIDRIVVPGRTIAYGANGAEGLAGGKRVILAITRGSVFAGASPIAAAEHAESHLRTVFGFLGVTDLEIVIAEGLATGGEDGKASSLAAAHAAVEQLAA